MRKILAIAALLAATVATPAFAQDGRHDHGGENRGSGGYRGGEPHAQAAPQQHYNGGGQRPQQAVAPNPGYQQARQAQQVLAVQSHQWNGYRGGTRQQSFVRPAAPVAYAQRGQDFQRRADSDHRGYGEQRVVQHDQQINGDRDHRGDDRRSDSYRHDDHRSDGYRHDEHRSDDRRFGQDGRGYEGDRGRDWNRDWRRDQRYDYRSYRTTNNYAFHVDRYYAPYGWNYGYRRFSVGFSLNSVLFDQQYWIDDPYAYRLPPAYGPYRWVRYYDDVLLIDVRDGQVVDAIYDFFW